MKWIQRHRLRAFLKNSLWPQPLACMAAAFIATPLVRRFDRFTGWTLHADLDNARALVAALSSALLTFIVFLFSWIIIALQIASASLTPRVIALVFNDLVTKMALSVFVFSYTFSLIGLAHLGTPVGLCTGAVMAYGSLACIAFFLILIDRAAKSLRPVSIMVLVANEGVRVVESVYPEPITIASASRRRSEADLPGTPGGEPIIVGAGRHTTGYLLAFDRDGLAELAQREGCTIELVPEVGDFIGPDDPLFRIHGDGHGIRHESLRETVAVGPERTLEQDPTFAFRVLVDLASKALSPAINDPTTAVLALDQIHRLMRVVGMRHLDIGQVRDPGGQLRLVYGTPDWEDYVSLAVIEIRQFGGQSIQITRRLRAMLEDLIHVLPERRSGPLREEVTILHRGLERSFKDPEDQSRADTMDAQGVGGHRARTGSPATNAGNAV